MRIEHKLLTVLSRQDVDRLLDSTGDLKYKAMLATMYSSVLRVSKVIHLHYEDISQTNEQIHVRESKSRMDRYTILSRRNLDLLTEYWFQGGRPQDILFPNKFTGGYLTVSTLEQVMRRSVRDVELPAGATPHSLRHSFATHPMEVASPLPSRLQCGVHGHLYAVCHSRTPQTQICCVSLLIYSEAIFRASPGRIGSGSRASPSS